MSTYDFEPDPGDYGPEPDRIANQTRYTDLKSDGGFDPRGRPIPMPQGIAQNTAYSLCSRYHHGVGVYEFDTHTLLDLVRAVERHHKLIPQQNYVKL